MALIQSPQPPLGKGGSSLSVTDWVLLSFKELNTYQHPRFTPPFLRGAGGIRHRARLSFSKDRTKMFAVSSAQPGMSFRLRA